MDAKVVQDARSFLRSFRGALAFAEALDTLATLEADTATIQRAYEEANKLASNARAELEAIRTESAGVQAEADAIRAAAKAEAKRVKDQAAVAAAAKIKAADEHCESAVKRAKAEVAEWDKRIVTATKELENTAAALKLLNEQLANAKAEMQELVARLG